MKKMKLNVTLLIFGLLLSVTSCKKNDGVIKEKDRIAFDSNQLAAFFDKHPEFKQYQPQVEELYNKEDFHYVWYDKNGRIEFAEVLYNKVNQIKADGVMTPVPYKSEIDVLFDSKKGEKSTLENDLMVSSLYFFYTKNVLEGLDPEVSKNTGWYLPRQKVSYVDYLDELIKDPDLIKKDDSGTINQYYKLKKGLQRYQEIQKKGGWAKIDFPKGTKSLKPGDSSSAIPQIRKRLVATGDLKMDSGSATFDDDLKTGLANYEKRHNRKASNIITEALVSEMNIPVEERIKTIVVNMERCRWIDPAIMNSKELVAVNIPSYQLQYIKDGKPVLTSNVVVGKALNKTVVFSGQMSYIVFSPYWNIPQSIIKEEIQPGIDKNPNYLEEKNMEWNNGNVRQKPGKNNSLGLVKFMFPNSNNIYLHDTPAKSLFARESRAFSHGCVRVEKARELAIEILKGDKNMTAAKIDAKMNAGTESNHTLDHKIPVYIAYFTAWADESGNVNFYEDIYKRDARLAASLYN